MAGKKVLIICYSFPPFPGIGGRRWAKFAKYFAKNGVQCHVVNAYNYSKSISLWNKDIENPNIIIHPLKFRFQYLLGLNSKKPGYRILSKLLRTLINATKYSPYFSTSLSGKLLQNRCIQLIKQYQIDTVIASGDPYMHYYVTGIKKKCNVKVVLDYRDTWNDRKYYSLNKFHKLTDKQRTFFEFCEKDSLKNCDEVVCVYQPMIELLSTRGEKDMEHFHVIPNGFDKDDYPDISAQTFSNKAITFYFGGSISPGDRADYFIRFLQAYSQLRNSNEHLWKQFRIIINGDSPSYFDKELEKLNNSNIILEKVFLSGKEYIEKLNSSDFGLLSVNDEYADCLFITKAYDYLHLGKPVIHLGKKGKVSEFIEKNGIGFTYDPNEKAEVFFQKLLNTLRPFQYPKELHDKIENDYDIKNIAAKYIDLIK